MSNILGLHGDNSAFRMRLGSIVTWLQPCNCCHAPAQLCCTRQSAHTACAAWGHEKPQTSSRLPPALCSQGPGARHEVVQRSVQRLRRHRRAHVVARQQLLGCQRPACTTEESPLSMMLSLLSRVLLTLTSPPSLSHGWQLQHTASVCLQRLSSATMTVVQLLNVFFGRLLLPA